VNKMTVKEQFKALYGGIDFPLIIFRKGAPFTAEFGLDTTFKVLRLHRGVDRGHGSIFVPFESYLEFTKDPKPNRFGNILFLKTNYDFEVRIAHMTRLSSAAMDYNKSSKPIPRGMYLGETGNEGLSTGPHSHTEIISFDEDNICEQILAEKYGILKDIPYQSNELKEFAERKGLDKTKIEQQYKTQKAERLITFCNRYKMRGIDYWTGKNCTWYSSQYLFDM